MTEVVLYHHVQGLTDGVRSFADELRQAGHTVHTPDLFDGRTFATIEEGMAFAREAGFGALAERGVAAAEEFGADVVYAGFSFGVMPAQQLAQTRPGARGALFMSACLPVSEFGTRGPRAFPCRCTARRPTRSSRRTWRRRALSSSRPSGAELFLYPGEEHLFADSSLPAYDPAAATTAHERVLAFLERGGRRLATTYTIKALDETTWDAFAALVEANNGVFGGCWCMGFHPEGGDRETDAASTASASSSASRQGTTHAALVFDGDDCLGWCQFGAPDELPRIKSRAAYEKGATTPPDWRIACNFVGKGHRRKGVATAALAGALDLIARLGGGTVEGYPEGADNVPAGFLFNGALSTYERLGFERDRKIGKHRWVVTRVVKPARAQA